uniref:G protein alpha subunit n=1 Tax=Panagrolaimus sp. ES5 TaxID=591445 RepID=A0AC34GVR7_9BILA
MKILHLNGFTDADKANFKDPIRRNTIDSLLQLLAACKEIKIAHDYSIQIALHEFEIWASQMKTIQENIEIPDRMIRCIQIIWKSGGIQTAYKKRWSFYLLDSAKYFLDSAARIGADDYLPEVQDIVQCRFPTQGTEEITFRYENMNFCMVDVGGQRSERRKWIHCFDNVSMLLFVAALSDYDLLDPENNNQKRLSANRYIFKTIVQSSFFKEAAIVLFLNKFDTFTEKLKYQPLSKYYPEYTGTSDPNEASDYIGSQFRKCVRDKNKYFMFCTTATDTRNVEFVFASAVTHIINQNLRATGSY